MTLQVTGAAPGPDLRGHFEASTLETKQRSAGGRAARRGLACPSDGSYPSGCRRDAAAFENALIMEWIVKRTQANCEQVETGDTRVVS